jgi:putative Holliday junction resolvase
LLPEMKRILGIDLGEARIGLAISDELGMLAHPLETIHVKELSDPVAHIAAIVTRDEISTLILGLPRNMNGTYGPAAEKARTFATKLRERTGCEVKMWDERLTSVAAQRSPPRGGSQREEEPRDHRSSRRPADPPGLPRFAGDATLRPHALASGITREQLFLVAPTVGGSGTPTVR